MFNSIIESKITKYVQTVSKRYNIPDNRLFHIWNNTPRINNLVEQLRSIRSVKTLKGNTQDSSIKQTEQVKSILEDFGFKNACIAGTKTGLLYKEQPNGGQKSPDFHLINGTHILNFELKKSNTNIIMWNDGFPHRDTLYLISCKDFTRLCSGKSLATDEEIEMYNKQRELISIMNKTLKTQNKKNRINFYTRRANSQKIEPANINSDLLDCYPLLSKLIN
jgi:hypothetical protein